MSQSDQPGQEQPPSGPSWGLGRPSLSAWLAGAAALVVLLSGVIAAVLWLADIKNRLETVEGAYVSKPAIDRYTGCINNQFRDLHDFSKELATWAAKQSLQEARLWAAWNDAAPQFWTYYLHVILMDVSDDHQDIISDLRRAWVDETRRLEQSKQSGGVQISASLHLVDYVKGLIAGKQLLADLEIDFQKCTNVIGSVTDG